MPAEMIDALAKFNGEELTRYFSKVPDGEMLYSAVCAVLLVWSKISDRSVLARHFCEREDLMVWPVIKKTLGHFIRDRLYEDTKKIVNRGKAFAAWKREYILRSFDVFGFLLLLLRSPFLSSSLLPPFPFPELTFLCVCVCLAFRE